MTATRTLILPDRQYADYCFENNPCRATTPEKLYREFCNREPVRSLRILLYCPANWLKTFEHAGESEAAFAARHCMIRPPPAGMSPHSARASSPHPDRKAKITSRGRIGRSTSAGAAPAGAASGLAVAASAGAPPVAGDAAALTAF